MQKKKTDAQFKPVSSEDDAERPMSVDDHVMGLRYTIHQLVAGVADISVEGGAGTGLRDEVGVRDKARVPTDGENIGEVDVDGIGDSKRTERYLTEAEMPKPLDELLSKETHEKYEAILANFRKIAEDGELVDVDDAENSRDLEDWIEQLTTEIKEKKGGEISEADLQELDAQCWLLFEAMANVINTETVEKGVKTFYEGKDVKALLGTEREKLKKECIEELGKKYPLSEVELGILVDLVVAEDDGEAYSFKILIETIARLWKECNLGDQKKAISIISVGNLMGQAAMSYAPSLWEGVMEGGNFNVMVFLEYLGLNKIGDIFGLGSEIQVAQLSEVINERINLKITNSLFFQEFEFVQGQTFGEIYSKLIEGKEATRALLTQAVEKLVPTVAGLLMSLAFLTKINPILGTIGLAVLPIMFQTAKKTNQKMWDVSEKEIAGEAEVAGSLGSVQQGIEEVRTSADIVGVQKHVKGLLDKKDAFSVEKMRMAAIAKFKLMLPFDLGQAIAAVAGFILQQMGEISGSTVLANTFYSERLHGPIYRLVNMYFQEFSRYVQNIKKMEEILGKYENLDLPEGEKEKERVSVEELESMDISVRDLSFKGILENLNLEVKQGEFVTIVGDSGGGKSTLLRLLAGLYKPEEGEVRVGGTELKKIKKYGPQSIYSRMSYSNQAPQIFKELTLRENLLLWTKTEVSEDQIVKVMKDLRLDKFVDKLDTKVTHLSGGEKVRVGLARTLIKGAQILLLDEPTTGLDSKSGAEARKVVTDIKKNYPNITIICVTHDEKLMASSERVLDINELQGKAA